MGKREQGKAYLDFLIELLLPSQKPFKRGAEALWTARFIEHSRIQPVLHRQRRF